MNEALNEAVYERFRFIEEKLYWLQFIRFSRGPFIVQMLHIPALIEVLWGLLPTTLAEGFGTPVIE
jgi:hypothetical protein